MIFFELDVLSDDPDEEEGDDEADVGHHLGVLQKLGGQDKQLRHGGRQGFGSGVILNESGSMFFLDRIRIQEEKAVSGSRVKTPLP